MNNIIACDFVFVPNGAPFPHDWVRRHPNYITLPARFKRSPAFMRRMFGPRYGQKPVPRTIEAERPAEILVASLPGAALAPQNHVPNVKQVPWDLGEIDSLARPFLDVADLGFGLLTERFGPGIRVAANGPLPIAAAQPPTARYIAKRPEDWDGHEAVGTGYCVPLVQEATGTPKSTEWKRGTQVWGTTGIPRGTAIATFGADGHDTSNTDGTAHAAIYLYQDAAAIHVIDQFFAYKGKGNREQIQPHRRVISAHSPEKNMVNQAEKYYIIE
jgi:hypothetical protein